MTSHALSHMHDRIEYLIMEWRIFFPIQESEPSVWPLVGEPFKFHSEERTDVYISCTEAVGLKLRGKEERMEIKVRGSKYICGSEQWFKVGVFELHSIIIAFCVFYS